MTQADTDAPVVTVKAEPDVYTVLLIVAILALGVSIGLVLYNLMSAPPDGYDMSFGTLFDTSKWPEPIRPRGK
jgi:hypothetical protein